MAIPPLSTGPGQGAGLARPASGTTGQARAAAQRAFFEAALGRAQTPAAATSATAQSTPQATRVNVAQEPAPADRIARPGSLINIVV